MKKIVLSIISMSCTFPVFAYTYTCYVENVAVQGPDGFRVVPVESQGIEKGIDFEGSHFSAISFLLVNRYMDPGVPCLSMNIEDVTSTVCNMKENTGHSMMRITKGKRLDFYCFAS